MTLAAVVIPVYKKERTAYEQIALEQGTRVLSSHPIIVVKPRALDLSDWLTTYPMLRFESFDDRYFRSIQGYNELLCSELFYERLLTYEYILIYQLDSFVLRDALADWCARGYDYVGAPQFSDIRPQRPTTLRDTLSRVLQQPLLNGGLSLRRVAACLRLLRVYHRFNGRWPGNEDAFFSLHYPRLLPYRPLMHLPKPEVALDFAMELEPSRSVSLNAGRLPMGCHAWHVYDLAFWRPIFQQYGYQI